MSSPVLHFEIGGADGARSRRFYGELFGWSVTPEEHGYSLVSTGTAAGIGGGIMQTPEGVPPWVTVYVRVDDLEKSLARAEELGGSRIMGPASIGERGEVAMFADPDGNPIGLLRLAPEETP
ncbi:VOC family protein [Actinomycetospora straminea]|uniref:VOC family protein n=1 Tax=Actinomycetospora straminea TaxID=663607 RepID=A0ABP9EJ65_9PSEU|nr:VOC family protein [Actinomycetospora straminea]MDD7933182.1 VOC family protein [Actinomycetospora straminea]